MAIRLSRQLLSLDGMFDSHRGGAIRIRAEVKGVNKLRRKLKRMHERSEKSLQTATRVEAFRLSRELKREIRAGAPGGVRLARLSFLARRSGINPRRLRPDRPLAGFARNVGYQVSDRNPYTVKVGFVRRTASPSVRKLVRMHQEGFSFGEGSREGTQRTGMDERKRSRFRRVGGSLSQRAMGRRQMFLRKSTRRFGSPARPIIDPFWRAHRAEAVRNIQSNFRKKMRGERV